MRTFESDSTACPHAFEGFGHLCASIWRCFEEEIDIALCDCVCYCDMSVFACYIFVASLVVVLD